MKNTHKRLHEQMSGIVSLWSDSHLKLPDYCDSNNISLSKFRYWQNKLRAEATPSGSFKSVKVGLPKEEKTIPTDFIKVEYPSGITIQLPLEIDIVFLQTLIRS